MERFPVASTLTVQRQKKGRQSTGTDTVAEEVPVALTYNGISYAVMLATPADLEDFAIGFSLTEGIVSSLKEIYGIEVEEAFNGIRVDVTIASEQFIHLKERRRNLTGRTGCGLCGTDSLAQAVKVLPRLSATPDAAISPILAGFNQMASQQSLKQRTGATHAAAWLSADCTIGRVFGNPKAVEDIEEYIKVMKEHIVPFAPDMSFDDMMNIMRNMKLKDLLMERHIPVDIEELNRVLNKIPNI